ncbi:hypothetical protein PR048_015036 [Dryococelus australis]|uniref:Uncharacterized protein n=1 Tax=Dryococelus australis TaxID=614101 RepID=A0ABQ9HFW1_9NEOP|nr:hypothetical protein PR048_015036 [Dryococelus australis]
MQVRGKLEIPEKTNRISGIVRHVPHVRESGGYPTGNRTQFALVGGETVIGCIGIPRDAVLSSDFFCPDRPANLRQPLIPHRTGCGGTAGLQQRRLRADVLRPHCKQFLICSWNSAAKEIVTETPDGEPDESVFLGVRVSLIVFTALKHLIQFSRRSTLAWLVCECAFQVQKQGSDNGDTSRCIKSHIVSTHQGLPRARLSCAGDLLRLSPTSRRRDVPVRARDLELCLCRGITSHVPASTRLARVEPPRYIGPGTYRLFTSKYINRIRLERASQKQSSDAHKTPYDRVKRCRERKINTKATERVNIDVQDPIWNLPQKIERIQLPKVIRNLAVQGGKCHDGCHTSSYTDRYGGRCEHFSASFLARYQMAARCVSPVAGVRTPLYCEDSNDARSWRRRSVRTASGLGKGDTVGRNHRSVHVCEDYFCELLEIPEKTRRPAASSGTIPTRENPGATPPGIEPDRAAVAWWTLAQLCPNCQRQAGTNPLVATPSTTPTPTTKTPTPLRPSSFIKRFTAAVRSSHFKPAGRDSSEGHRPSRGVPPPFSASIDAPAADVAPRPPAADTVD